jgi:hypothetical protein
LWSLASLQARCGLEPDTRIVEIAGRNADGGPPSVRMAVVNLGGAAESLELHGHKAW